MLVALRAKESRPVIDEIRTWLMTTAGAWWWAWSAWILVIEELRKAIVRFLPDFCRGKSTGDELLSV